MKARKKNLKNLKIISEMCAVSVFRHHLNFIFWYCTNKPLYFVRVFELIYKALTEYISFIFDKMCMCSKIRNLEVQARFSIE